jgi:ABC-2 type transport system ATP-binding protein
MSGSHRKRDAFGRRKPVPPPSPPARSIFLGAESAEPMVETEDLTKQFGSVLALDSVSLTVRRGSVLGLLGHNGAGKTTLVNILATALPPTSGLARIAGFDVMGEPREVRKRIGLTGQFASVDGRLSGQGNLMLIAKLLGARRKEAKARADELLEAFDLEKVATRRAGTYSGGLRRRLDLAASLVGSPDVIFLDEPTTGLDPSSRLRLWEIVKGLVEEGTTVLLTTQYLDEADRLADSIILLSSGAVVASGTVAELKSQVGRRRASVILGSASEAGFVCRMLEKAGMAATIGRENNTVILTAGTPREMADVLRTLDLVGIDPTELSYSHPSLDDVYLALGERKESASTSESEETESASEETGSDESASEEAASEEAGSEPEAEPDAEYEPEPEDESGPAADDQETDDSDPPTVVPVGREPEPTYGEFR